MAITVVFEFPNDSVKRYDQASREAGDLRTQPTRSHHICFETPSGFTVVDVWESEVAFAKFGAANACVSTSDSRSLLPTEVRMLFPLSPRLVAVLCAAIGALGRYVRSEKRRKPIYGHSGTPFLGRKGVQPQCARC